MSVSDFITSCLALVAAASIASAEVPKELRGQLVRARSSLKSAESMLSNSRDAPAGSSEAQRAADTATTRLDKAERLAQGLPPGDAEVDELLARIKAARGELATRRSANTASDQAAAADTVVLEAGLEHDVDTIQAVTAKLVDVRSLLGDTLEIEGLELWGQVEKDGLALVAKYDGKVATSAAAKKMVEEVGRLRGELRDSRSRLGDYLTGFLPPKTEQYLKEAESSTKPGNEKSNIDVFIHGLAYANRSKVFLDKFDIIAPWFPGTDTSFVAKARARVAAIEARVEGAKDQVAIKNVPPTDGYAGKDKETMRTYVKNAWATVSPKYPALKITIPGPSWERHTDWVWNRDRWTKVDYSTLLAFVFYKSTDKLAFGWGVYLVRDHANGNAMRVKLDPAKDTPANWSQVYLMSKIK